MVTRYEQVTLLERAWYSDSATDMCRSASARVSPHTMSLEIMGS
jgi:hypothetical protein